MIIKLFQSIGIVFSFIILILVSILAMYISYIAAIGILIIGAIFIVYNLIRFTKSTN